MKEDTGRKCKSCFLYVKNIGAFLASHIGLVSMVVGYCLIGALTFEALEKRHEAEVKQNMIWKRKNITQKVWDTTHRVPYLQKSNWTGEVASILRKFETDLLTALRRDGWDGTEDFENHQWTFAGSLFYSIIVITTIGYGHIAPKTQWGKIVTILYAILGIPLMLLCLSNIGDGLAQSFRFLYWKVCCYACEKKPKRKKAPRAFGRSYSMKVDGAHANLHLATCGNNPRLSDSLLSDSALERSSLSVSDWNCRSPSRHCYDDAEITLSRGKDKCYPGTFDKRRRSEGPGFRQKTRNYTYPRAMASVRGMQLRHEQEEAAKVPVLFNRYAVDSQQDLSTGGGRPEAPPGRPEKAHAGVSSSSSSCRRPAPPSGGSQAVTVTTAATRDPLFWKDQMLRAKREFDLIYGSDDVLSDDGDPRQRAVPIWLCVVLVIGYILGGAFLFTNWEKWNYLDSAYFCFITLTTIGFGDFVPAQNTKENPEVSIALCSLYLLFGIALLAMSFNLVQEEVISNVKMVARKLGIIKDEDEEEDDDDDDD